MPELAALKRDFPEHIDIQLRVDSLDTMTAQRRSWLDWALGRSPAIEGLDVRLGMINEGALKRALEASKRRGDTRRILVCGPDGMIETVAGPKRGKQQGQLGGFLAGLGCQDDEVWKL